MRYRSGSAFRAALEARLLEDSVRTGLSLVRLRKSVAFSRLLARLLVVAPDRWVLKGGLAMDYRFGSRVRTTKDMDLASIGDEEAAAEDLIAAQAVEMGDYFMFEIERTGQLDEMEGARAIRYHVRCLLGGRLFEEVVVDVGFDLPEGWDPDLIQGPDLLGFAGIDPVAAPTLPLELQAAEKVHAYTRTYGDVRAASTRVKDLIDLVLIGTSSTLDAATLARALADTFDRRAQHDLPNSLPAPPAEWATPYAVLAREVGLPTDLAEAFRVASAVLDPVLTAAVTAGAWDRAKGDWDPDETAVPTRDRIR
jgi:hypothetical protein